MQRETKQLTFHDLFRILQRRRWLIVFCVLGIGAAGTLFSFAIPETYRASTVFLVKDPQYVANLYGGALIGVPFDRRLSTIEEDVRAYETVGAVVEDLGLARRGRSPGDVISRILNDLEVKVIPTRRGDTTVVLSYTDTSPSNAANVANWVRDRYITGQVDAYRKQVKAVVDRYAEQIDQQETAREKIYEEMRSIEEKHPLDVATRTAKSKDDLARLEAELRRRQTTLDAKRQELAEVEVKLKNSDKMDIPTERIRNKRYDELLEKVIQKRQEVARLEELFTDKYEPLQTAREVLKKLEDSLAAEQEFLYIQREKTVSEAYVKLEADQRRLRSEISGLESGVKEAEREARLLGITVRDLPRQREQWARLEGGLTDLSSAIAESRRQKARADLTWEVARESAGTHFEVIDAARPPVAPTGPNRFLWFLGSIAAGLAAGLGLSVLLHFLSQSLTTVEEARSFLGVPVMGAVPTIRSVFELQRDRRRRAMAFAMVMILVFSGAAFTLVYMEFPEVLPAFVRDSISALRDRIR